MDLGDTLVVAGAFRLRTESGERNVAGQIAAVGLGAQRPNPSRPTRKPRSAAAADKCELGEPPTEPTDLNTDTIIMETPPTPEPKAEYNDESTSLHGRGGGTPATPSRQSPHDDTTGFNMKAWGPGKSVQPRSGHGSGHRGPGMGGIEGYGCGQSRRSMGAGGGTRSSPSLAAPAYVATWKPSTWSPTPRG